MSRTDRSLPVPRALQPMVCTSIGLAVNLVLTVGKIAVGLLARSAALVADGAHSLSDMASDIGILLALRASRRPADENHPYGHYQFEALGGMGVALVLLVTGVLIGNDAVQRLRSGQEALPSVVALATALVSLVIKEAVARYTFAAGRRNNSPALAANAKHHRSDALTSAAAAAGILGAMVGWPWADSAMALLIAFFILHMGWTLVRENSLLILDTQARRDVLERIERDSLAVGGVLSVGDLRVRQRGSYYLVDINIGVRPDLPVTDAHDLAHQVEEHLRDGNPHLSAVFVHVEPHVEPRAAARVDTRVDRADPT